MRAVVWREGRTGGARHGRGTAAAGAVLSYRFSDVLLQQSLLVDNRQANLNNGTYSNATHGGCATVESAANMTFVDSVVTGCRVEGRGGAVEAFSATMLLVIRSTFTNCTAVTAGGALRVHYSNARVINSSFLNNGVSSGSGGAIVVQGGSDLSCRPAGGDCLGLATLVLRGCTFSNNLALGGSGGAIRVYGTSSLEVHDTTFDGNFASGQGGSVLFDGGMFPLTMFNVSFTRNRAGAGCGALAALSGTAVNLTNVSAADNAALTGDGGALCYVPAASSQYTCTANTNTSIAGLTGDVSVSQAGTAVPLNLYFTCGWLIQPAYLGSGCSVELAFSGIEADSQYPMYSTVAVSDLATSQTLYYGLGSPAVLPAPMRSSSDKGLFLFYSWNFLGDSHGKDYLNGFLASYRTVCPSAAAPAALAVADACSINMADVALANNSAGPGGSGGALSVSVPSGFVPTRSAVASLRGGSISGNIAGLNGGGIALTGNAPLFMSSVAVSDNSAELGLGGGAYVLQSPGAVFTACSFSLNYGFLGGGGVAFDSSPLAVDSSSFGTNDADGDGGAVAIVNTNGLTISASVLLNNTAAGRGGAVAAINVTQALLANVTMAGNLVSSMDDSAQFATVARQARAPHKQPMHGSPAHSAVLLRGVAATSAEARQGLPK